MCQLNSLYVNGKHSMIDTSQVFLSPAKLNLFLHITGRRDDGYHELQTVFQFIDLCDELSFQQRQDGIIKRCSEHEYPAEQDLNVRAAQLLQCTAKVSQGVDIRIKKHIPAGGGLGGGSSNAATCLLVLNQLWQCGFSVEQLARLGLELGADVPIFIHGQAAWAEGVGEKIHSVRPPENWFLLLAPQIHVSTAQVFAHSGLTRNTHTIKIRPLDESTAWQSHKNDCESIVRQEYPLIDQAISVLNQYAPAKLTGTGACVFAPFDSKSLAEQAQADLINSAKLDNTEYYLVKGVNQSPLHKQLGIV